MQWIELGGMWKKNVLNLDSNEVAESRRILEKYNLRVTDIASTLFKVDWRGAPKSRFSTKHDQFHADVPFEQEDEVLEKSLELAKSFGTDRVRCFDFWRLDDPKPHRKAMNDKLRGSAEKAAKQGIVLVLETEGSCNTATGVEAGEVLRARQTPALMLNKAPSKPPSLVDKAFPAR